MNDENQNVQNPEENLNSISLGSIGGTVDSIGAKNEPTVEISGVEDVPVLEEQPELFDIPVNIPPNNNGVVNSSADVTPSPIPTELPNDIGSVPIDDVDSNAYVETERVESIGVEPPKAEEPKKKKGNKTLFLVLIIILIFAVAAGIMFLLNQGQSSSSNISVITKTISLPLGEKPSTNIDDYATFNGTSSTNCQLDTTNIVYSTAGNYEYTITCGSSTYKGSVIVEDKTSPVVSLNVVYAYPDSNGVYNVTLDDFVDTCVDPSECSLAFVDEAALKTNLEQVGGPYIVGISATDKLGNSTTINGEMYVLKTEPAALIGCANESVNVTEANASKSVKDIFAIGNNDGVIGYMGAARREVTYKFNTEASYKEVTVLKSSSITFDNVTGLAKYSDNDLSITISSDLSMDTLTKESGGTFNTEYLAIREMYENNGYKCEIVNK